MNKPEAYPITYGVLGLLAFWGPMSGYDIKHLFDHILAPMWGAAHSQIYNELKRMKELGWVVMEREEQETRPDRKVYQVTSQGQEALKDWQSQPAVFLQLRDELLLKFLFGSFASPGDLVTNLKAGIEQHEQRLLEYRQNEQYMPRSGQQAPIGSRPNPYLQESSGENDPYFALISRFAIDIEKTYLNWLYEALTFVEGEGQTIEQERNECREKN